MEKVELKSVSIIILTLATISENLYYFILFS